MQAYKYDEKFPFVILDATGGVIARFAERHMAEEYAFDYSREVIDTGV